MKIALRAAHILGPVCGLLVACAAEVKQNAPPASTPTPATPPVAVQVTQAPNATSSALEQAQLAVQASDRSADDRALDDGRKPAETLAFFKVQRGSRVLELGAGRGYTTELLARIVGPEGKVYGQNSKFILERFAEKPWAERLAKPVMNNVVRVDREFDDPILPDMQGLDAVINILFYHDTVWLKTDRDKMNRALFAALKSGGVYGIVDHAAKAGAGIAEVERLHRIEESNVIQEVERAGFKLEARGDFLKNPADPRDWNASPRVAAERRGTSDRFVLRFVKP